MKYQYLLLLLPLVLVAGCVAPGNNSGNTTNSINVTGAAGTNSSLDVVVNGSVVTVDYTGMLTNGTVFDSSAGRTPLRFVAGAGYLIKGFEDAVIGMHLGEEKNVTIPPEDAYGFYNASRVIEVNISLVPNNTKAGDVLYAGTQPVLVKEVRNETVVIDTNHPLAGETLIFDIKVLKIEAPTAA